MAIKVQIQSRDGERVCEREMKAVPRVDDDIEIYGESGSIYSVVWQVDDHGPDVVVVLA